MTQKTLFWEDFELGRRWSAVRSKLLTSEEIVSFAKEYDPLEIHVDPERAGFSPLGVHCASGVQTFGIAQRLMCEAMLLQANIVAGNRIDQFRMLTPVVPGDLLRLETQVIETKPHSTKADRGWVVFKVEVTKCDQKKVLVYETSILMVRRGRIDRTVLADKN